MANIQRNFIAGRMNKSLDERLIPNGEYVDALNVRLGSTESSEIGSVENSKGNTSMTSLQFIDGVELSENAKCIGAFEDGSFSTIYWFVHDPSFTSGDTGKLDLIVSFNEKKNQTIYHIISINDGSGTNTTLNFNPSYLITGVNRVGDLLFFTDNYNPPRFINIKKNYSNPIVVTPVPPVAPVPVAPVPAPIVPVPIVPIPVPAPVVDPQTGTCENIWVSDSVDKQRYGLRYLLPNVGQTDTLFENLFGTPYNFSGDNGVVFSVCSTINPQTWDSNTNTTVDLGSLVVQFASGGSCTENNQCEWVEPTL